jgi:hypothetical protein
MRIKKALAFDTSLRESKQERLGSLEAIVSSFTDALLAVDPLGQDAFAFGQIARAHFNPKRNALHLVFGKLPARRLALIVIEFDPNAFFLKAS